MSAFDGLAAWALVLLTAQAAFGTPADLPEEPRADGTILLPGRLPWGASALPGGDFLAPCEDQVLTVLDGQAQVEARWQAPARFSGPVTVAPRGPVQLLAVPLVTGQVQILGWDPGTRVLAPEFSLAHPVCEPAATAWGAGGVLASAWRDGHLEVRTSQGTVLWTRDLGTDVRNLLFDDSLGIYAFGSGIAVLVDRQGKEAGRWPISGTPKGLVQTVGGDLYCWTETGLWKKSYDGQAFTQFDKSPRLLGVTVDRQDQLVLTDPGRLRRLSADGLLVSDTELPDKAVTAGVIDDRGRILVGTTAGMEVWAYDGRFLGTLDPAPPASPVQLTTQGLGVWSSSDWTVHVWSGFRWPPYGWPEEGGGPGKPFSARRPSTIEIRSKNWADDPEFNYFYQMVASGEEAKQQEVLDRFEAKAVQGDLLDHWPFANIILLKIGQSGLVDLLHDPVRVANNWPGLRLRAYGLLARTAGPEDRNELMDLIHREFDPAAAAQGALALARTGWDGDGRLMRLLSELQHRMASQSVVADAAVDAARNLWVANGRSTDPSLVPLLTAVFQGPYPRSVKLKAQKFFQDLMDAP